MREIRTLRLTRRELETEPPGYRANSRPYIRGLPGALLTGDCEFARELRQWYRDFTGIWPTDSAWIAPAELQKFLYLLQLF